MPSAQNNHLRQAVDAPGLKVPVAGVVRHGRHAPLGEALLDDRLHVVRHRGELVLVQREVRELVALGGLGSSGVDGIEGSGWMGNDSRVESSPSPVRHARLYLVNPSAALPDGGQRPQFGHGVLLASRIGHRRRICC